MKAHLLLALLLSTALASSTAAQDRPQSSGDPCELARRIALSPPCLAGSACEALELWRDAFGLPDIHPAGAGELPPELASRLPDAEVTLGKLDSYEVAFRKLGEASGVEVLLQPGIEDETVTAQLGPMPVAQAWRALLKAGGFLTRFEDERLLIAQSPSGPPRPRGRSRSMFNCPVR